MAKRAFALSEEAVEEIRQRESATREAGELRRLQGVRMYGTGHALRAIQDLIGCGESSLREWVGKYQQGGVTALVAGYQRRARNASKLTVAQEAELRERLHEYRPDELLSEAGRFWTVGDLQIVVERWYNVRYKDAGSYVNLLHRCGFSYQRAEKAYKSRPREAEIAAFEAELEKK